MDDQAVLKKFRDFLEEKNLKPCEFPYIPRLENGMLKSNLFAVRVREVSFSLFRQVVIEREPELRDKISDNAYGKITRACMEMLPSLHDFFTLMLKTDDARLWETIGLDSEISFDDSLIHQFIKAFSDKYDEGELQSMAKTMMVLFYDKVKRDEHHIISLHNFEVENNLPLLEGSERQVEWARNLRFDKLSKDLLPLSKARTIIRAKTLIEKFKPMCLPFSRDCFRFKEELKSRFDAKWNHKVKKWTVTADQYDVATKYVGKRLRIKSVMLE